MTKHRNNPLFFYLPTDRTGMSNYHRMSGAYPPSTRTYSVGATSDPQRLSPQQVANLIKYRPKGQPYIRPDVWTPESESKWIESVYVGKIARNLILLAKNTMAATLTSDDPDIAKLCSDMSRKTHLIGVLQMIRLYWDKYGRVFVLPVWNDANRRELRKIKLIYPPTVTVYRNNPEDITKLQEKLRGAKLPLVTVEPGSGDDIVGYLQEINNHTWYFSPEELIFIPRYPDGQRPDGYSLLVQAADIISAKLQIETDQVIMATRHGDPKHVFHIPAAWFQPENKDKLNQLKEDLKEGIRSGDDFYLSSSDIPDENISVELLQATGNPQAVIKSQDHAENQFIATFGLADSFTESESSNRSVGEIQLAFFERDITADRIMFAEILEDQLIAPWLKANGKPENSAWFEFSDLTPDDRLTKLQILAPLFPYLEQSIVDQVLEQAGYIIHPKERPSSPPASASMRRYGTHAMYSRLRGISHNEAELIRAGRDVITEQVKAYKEYAQQLAERSMR